MTDIKPRWKDGVPWCDAGCPQCRQLEASGPVYLGCMALDGRNYLGHVCPHHAARMAVELEAWRSLRPEVAAFALMMEDRLRANDHKTGWLRCDVGWLFGRLLDEAAKLHHALEGDYGDSDEEAADVANFAMMICDNLGGLNVSALMAEREE